MNSGAGMATNAGINYQQRVSASFLTLMIIRQEISIFANYSIFKDQKINSLQLEGIDKVDDLIIELDNKQKLFFQIKRKVNLSDSKQSDFYKTIDQFVHQSLNNRTNELFFLVTTSYSSSKITRDLKKITDSIRLNNLSLHSNSFNQSEKEALEKYKKVVQICFKKYVKRDIQEKELIEFSKKVFILNFDIEDNSTMEKAVFALMANKIIISPSSLWNILITNCLSYASQRMSISYKNSQDIYKSYLITTNLNKNDNLAVFDDFLKPSFEHMNIASGKEVLLCKPCDFLSKIMNDNNKIDFYIIELFRFDDDCNKKVQFTNTHCILSDNQTQLEIIYRTSTSNGLKRFMDENKSLFAGKSITVLPANGIDYIESSICAKAYSENLMYKLKEHKEYLKCIKCGKAIAENNSIVVEIDLNGFDNIVGLVHKDCLSSTMRVLGIVQSDLFKDYSSLRNFDWKLWVDKIMRGQGLFGTKILTELNSNAEVLWNSSVEYNSNFNYCIKEHLEDGTFQYVLRRGKVELFQKQEAEKGVIQFNKILEEQERKGDFICVTRKEKVFSTYKVLKDKIDVDDKLLKVEKYSVEKATQQTIDDYSVSDNYYTPLFYILEGDNQEIFAIEDRVVLMNDPFLFKNYLENWENNLNLNINDNYEVVIIEDDKHFDNFMHSIYKKNMKAVINPFFDVEGNFIKGFRIEKLEDLQTI
ncbi:MAG: hypothetical protein AB1389_03635 [Campylobacterota bacterium]